MHSVIAGSSRRRSSSPGFSLAARRASIVASLAGLTMAGAAQAQIVSPEFAPFYEVTDLGHLDAIPSPYGGLSFDFDDPGTLFLAGSANTLQGTIFALTVKRSASGAIVGFDCAPPVPYASAPGVTGGIDGGLDHGPGNVLFYTTYGDNHLGQIKPGSTAPDRLTNLSTLGVVGSVGTLRFVPEGFAGAGQLKICTYGNSRWYSVDLTPAGDGTYDVAVDPNFVQLGGGPEGIVYIKAGNPGFTKDSVLVSLYGVGWVVAYEIDANGNPIPESSRTFITNLAGAEGAEIDPVTGDFLFSTFGGSDRVIRVSGFDAVGCLGDLNLDGDVNGADITIVLGDWGATDGGATDLDGNCVTDGGDITTLLGNWGPCIP